jgi:type I restriction enzyme S subunit
VNKGKKAADTREVMLERLDDIALAKLVREREHEPTIKVGLDDLLNPDETNGGEGLKVEERRGNYRVSPASVGWVRPEAVTRHAVQAPMAPLSELTDLKIDQGGPLNSGEFTYIDISSVDNKLKRITEPKTLANEAAPSRAKQRLRSGDVLVSMTRPNLNAVAIVPPELDGAVGSTGFHVLRATQETEPRWLSYAVQTKDFIAAMSELVQGALYPAVRPKDIRAFEIPHPPLDQQKRIVAEIEKQFSRLDEAVANLKHVKSNLKRYKAAVLKATIEGRLVETEAERARREGRSYETGAQLLQRILETRRSQWQGKGKYKEPTAPDTTDLPELPEGWVWATLGALLVDIEAGKSFKCEERPPTKDEVGVVKVSAVTWGEFDETESKTCLESRLINERFLIRRGDFLFSRANTIELVGACVIAKKVTSNVMLSDKILRFLLLGEMDQWVLYNLRGKFGREEIERLATGNQESMRNIGQERIRAIRIPLPPVNECGRIVTEIERRLSLVNEGGLQVDTNLQRAERLRQAVLARAFSGKLIDENRTDSTTTSQSAGAA